MQLQGVETPPCPSEVLYDGARSMAPLGVWLPRAQILELAGRHGWAPESCLGMAYASRVNAVGYAPGHVLDLPHDGEWLYDARGTRQKSSFTALQPCETWSEMHPCHIK